MRKDPLLIPSSRADLIDSNLYERLGDVNQRSIDAPQTRRSDRVFLNMPLEVSGSDAGGNEFLSPA